MKFVLIIQICSALTNTCQEAYKPTVQFGTFYDCGISGYSIASSTIKKMSRELVEKDKIYVRFGCIEKNLKEEDANKGTPREDKVGTSDEEKPASD